ncbi:MAG: M23 family metallopeptidase [Bacteroidia bacterium]
MKSFYFNPHELLFETKRRPPIYLLGIIFLLGTALGALLTFLPSTPLDEVWLRLSELRIAPYQKAHKSTQKAIQEIEDQLQVFYQRLKNFYEPIMGQEPLPPVEWQGATGGSEDKPLPSEIALYRSQILLSRYRAVHEKVNQRVEWVRYTPCIHPLPGHPIVSNFGYRYHPLFGGYHFHAGIDIDAPYGTPVRATASGKVRCAGWDFVAGNGYGIQVEIDHLYGYVTKYAHLSRVAVQVGQTVKRGDLIGYVGSTGYSTAPHLHYEVIYHSTKLDPRNFLLLP